MHQIENPVIRGFNPDPSIVRVGDDYYIANSTFEWWPGVALHHSRDLVHWRLIGHALTRESQLRLRGIADSGGVWAPSLSHHDGQFWLIYTNVRTCGMGRPFKDVGIYLTTAPSILGPWSEPVVLNTIGFDPSLFHDEDGKKWLVNMIWDFRKGRNKFGGIVVQEYDHERRQLVGPITNVLQKKVLTEGPNLYRRDGWYYLMLAEGGTGWNHGISMARSRRITGPYELDPQASVLTSRDNASLTLQKAGHGELVQTPGGEWYLVHLASRPLGTGENRRCILGRETCLQRVEWKEGWLRLAQGGTAPLVNVAAPLELAPSPWPAAPVRDDFDGPPLDVGWSSLRGPADETWASLSARPGWLRLRGRESLHSLYFQTLVARRITSVVCTAETKMNFAPKHFMHMAGLVCYYDTKTQYYLRATVDDAGRKVLGVVLSDDGRYDELEETQQDVSDWPDIYLRAEFDRSNLQFSASSNGHEWQKLGPVLDATKLSDDYGTGLHFTGTLVGICVQDLAEHKATADFDYFVL
ncbi:glycoside hydrolase family 43 protein [Oleiharenicola lentus]|uniref:glycoside hydrolase family 43 protein n=1 Tax=Oleiharenicola lentus TaxID=2508720 RepID=UPI003F67F0F2